MDNHNPFHHLRFERPMRLPIKPLVIGGALAAFTTAWWLMPHEVLFWLLLPTFAAMLWVASFGWRDAIRALQALLHRLEQA